MKYTLMILGLIFMMNAKAVEEAKKYAQPTEAEITKNRACFQALEVQGCRTIEEDPEQFRSCLSDTHTSLDDYCKNLMLKLYGSN